MPATLPIEETSKNSADSAEFFDSQFLDFDILGKVKRFTKNEKLFHEGDLAEGFFVIRKGSVRTLRKSEDGRREQTLKLYWPGSWVGLRDLLLTGVYQESASAIEASELIFVDKDTIQTLLSQNYDLQRRIMQYFASGWREAEDRVFSMGTRQVHAKVAELLLSLPADSTHEEEIEIKFTREIMASLIGAKKETIVRALADLKDREWIHIDKNHVTIINREALCHLIA